MAVARISSMAWLCSGVEGSKKRLMYSLFTKIPPKVSGHSMDNIPNMSGIFKINTGKYNRNHKEGNPVISYAPLWDTMKQKKISTYTLVNKYGFSRGTLDSLKQNRNISTATLNDICTILDCRVEDVLVYIPDTSEK